MPALKVHCQSSLARTGKTYEDLHKWMDEGQKFLDKDHRFERHSTSYIPYIMKTWGSGIKRIYEACKEEKVKVDFKKLKSGFVIVFYRKEKKEGMGEKVGEKVTDRVTEKVTDKVTENQAKILTEISKDRFITTKKLSLVVGISARKIKDNISKLKQKKLLKRIGPAKGGYWEVEGI